MKELNKNLKQQYPLYVNFTRYLPWQFQIISWWCILKLIFHGPYFYVKNKEVFNFIFLVNGNWNSWTSWGSCTMTCGGGKQTRSRSCSSPAPQYGGLSCTGSTTSTQDCNTQHCPSRGFLHTGQSNKFEIINGVFFLANVLNHTIKKNRNSLKTFIVDIIHTHMCP